MKLKLFYFLKYQVKTLDFILFQEFIKSGHWRQPTTDLDILELERKQQSKHLK